MAEPRRMVAVDERVLRQVEADVKEALRIAEHCADGADDPFLDDIVTRLTQALHEFGGFY